MLRTPGILARSASEDVRGTGRYENGMKQCRHSVPLALDITNIVKQFGSLRILRGITIQLAQGECLTIFGPNGAGKTTLLRILATLMKPTSGSGEVLGFDLATAGAHIRKQIGALTHQALLFPTLTAYENLKFYGQMFGVPSVSPRIDALLEQVGLNAHRDRIVETFSQGMQQRLALARVMLHAPRLLLLDEPYNGLDQDGIRILRQFLKSSREQSQTIVMTGHNFERGLEFCTKAAILKQGAIVHYDAPPSDIASFAALYQQVVG